MEDVPYLWSSCSKSLEQRQLYSSIFCNRCYLTLIFPASRLTKITKVVTNNGDAGIFKASGKKVKERHKEN